LTRGEISGVIAEAVEQLERVDLAITTESVTKAARHKLTYNHFPILAEHGLRTRVQRYLREHGYDITDTVTRERKSHWRCTIDELEEQRKIGKDNCTYTQNRDRAREMEIDLIRSKTVEMGYPVFPELFREDIERIYAMNGCSPPTD